MGETKKKKGGGEKPAVQHYESMYKYLNDNVKTNRAGKRMVKWKDTWWEQSRQALCRYYSSPAVWHELAAPGWTVFHQRVLKQSGKHRHQGGLPIYIVSGKGYSIIDGVRYDWKKGDLLIMPFKPLGCEHQHFSEDPDNALAPVWIALRWCPFSEFSASDDQQMETHPDWPGK